MTKSSGGRKSTKTISRLQLHLAASPGTNASTSPPRTSRIGYGIPNLRASVASATTAASSTRIISISPKPYSPFA